MTTELEALAAIQPPTVRISLKKSSSKDGVEGWDIDVSSDATEDDVDQAVHLALSARLTLRREMGLEPSEGA